MLEIVNNDHNKLINTHFMLLNKLKYLTNGNYTAEYIKSR